MSLITEGKLLAHEPSHQASSPAPHPQNFGRTETYAQLQLSYNAAGLKGDEGPVGSGVNKLRSVNPKQHNALKVIVKKMFQSRDP